MSGSFNEFVREIARIGPANRSSFADCFSKSGRVRYRFLEHRMQELNDELLRSFIVVVKDDMEVAGLGVNIAHRIMPLIGCHFGSCWNTILEQNRNKVTCQYV